MVGALASETAIVCLEWRRRRPTAIRKLSNLHAMAPWGKERMEQVTEVGSPGAEGIGEEGAG